MDNSSDSSLTFKEFLMSIPSDDAFSEILDHVRDCGCGLTNQERQFFATLCSRAISVGPQLLQRKSGKLVIMSEAQCRKFAGADAVPVWTQNGESVKG